MRIVSLVHRLEGTHINTREIDLGVTVLARLGSGHVDDFARTA